MQVEAILAHRGSGAGLEYEVKWAKWRETTWEPAENIVVGASEILEAYLAAKPRARPKKKQKTDEGSSSHALAEGEGEGADE